MNYPSPGAPSKRQTDRGANTPGDFQKRATELFAIASLHWNERHAINSAITAMGGHNIQKVIHELSAVKANAKRVADLSDLLLDKLLDADDYESSENVYEA